MTNGVDNCCLLLTNHNCHACTALLAVKHNVVKLSTKLITSLNSKHYRPLGILIYRQNSYAPRGRRCTDRRGPVNKGKNLPAENIPTLLERHIPLLETAKPSIFNSIKAYSKSTMKPKLHLKFILFTCKTVSKTGILSLTVLLTVKT
jgi:hypothetical protein